jgi:hypothetical protein
VRAKSEAREGTSLLAYERQREVILLEVQPLLREGRDLEEWKRLADTLFI